MYCLYLIRFRLVQVLNMQFYKSVAILGDDVLIFISNRLLSLVYMISYFTEYIDSQHVNMALSLSGINTLMGFTIWFWRFFQQITVLTVSHTLHSEITLQSPYIKPEYRYSLFWKIVESKVNVIAVFNGNGGNDFASFANGSFWSSNNVVLLGWRTNEQ